MKFLSEFVQGSMQFTQIRMGNTTELVSIILKHVGFHPRAEPLYKASCSHLRMSLIS